MTHIASSKKIKLNKRYIIITARVKNKYGERLRNKIS